MAEEDHQFSGIVSPLEVPNALVYVEEEEMGIGFLSIGEEDLYWATSSGDKEIKLKFPNIAIHAVSRDTSVFPFKPCVLVVYSTTSEEDDSEEEVTRNYRILTEEPEQLDQIYKMISDCQELYPDSELSSDSAEENTTAADGYFTTADGLQHLSLEGESVLNHLESILVDSQNNRCLNDLAQFEDADA